MVEGDELMPTCYDPISTERDMEVVLGSAVLKILTSAALESGRYSEKPDSELMVDLSMAAASSVLYSTLPRLEGKDSFLKTVKEAVSLIEKNYPAHQKERKIVMLRLVTRLLQAAQTGLLIQVAKD